MRVKIWISVWIWVWMLSVYMSLCVSVSKKVIPSECLGGRMSMFTWAGMWVRVSECEFEWDYE